MNYLSALPSSVPALSPLIPFFLYIFRATSPSPSCTLVWCPAPLCVLLYPRALLHLGVTPCARVRPAASSSCAASSYSRVHNRAPSYTIVNRVPSCTLAAISCAFMYPCVCPPATSCALLHPCVPSCTLVVPRTSCALLQHRVPSCNIVCPPATPCAFLHLYVPSFTLMCHPAPSYDLVRRHVQNHIRIDVLIAFLSLFNSTSLSTS